MLQRLDLDLDTSVGYHLVVRDQLGPHDDGGLLVCCAGSDFEGATATFACFAGFAVRVANLLRVAARAVQLTVQLVDAARLVRARVGVGRTLVLVPLAQQLWQFVRFAIRDRPFKVVDSVNVDAGRFGCFRPLIRDVINSEFANTSA